MNSQEDIKILMIKRHFSLKRLAAEFELRTGKKMLVSSLSQKLAKGTLRYSELVVICEILQYHIEYVENN